MKNKIKDISFLDAIKKSPGPDSLKESLTLSIKGFCMGCADVVPGVSGGTIAYITGIYEDLINAIKSPNLSNLSKLFKGDLKAFIQEIHTKFLIFLFLGIATAIISLAKIIKFQLEHHPIETFSLFLGLIGASIFILAKDVKSWFGQGGVCTLFGLISSYLLVGMVPVDTPNSLFFILLCGMIAISAMILPGISGSFILIILSKYHRIIDSIQGLSSYENLKLLFSGDSEKITFLMTLLVFGIGCILGLTLFSRVLSYLLANFKNVTISLLTGAMIGSMRKIWPWKIEGQENFLPNFDQNIFLPILFIIFGFIVVYGLQFFVDNSNEKNNTE